MVLMAVCAVLLSVGVLSGLLWGGNEVRQPELEDAGARGSAALAARRYVWYLSVAVVSGVGSGLLVAGAGGRLVMRLLAATAGNSAQGRETEAEEIVGRITTGGTVGFIVFTALFFGLATGALYLLIRRWLPRGRLGGLAFGGLLLVVAATRIDPLRAGNADFHLVGPGWLAVAAFGLLVLVHGILVAALAARYSRVLPLLSASRRSILAHAPLLLLLPVFPVLVVLAMVGVLVVALSRLASLVQSLRSHRALVAGRVMLAGISLLALPGSVSALVDIVARQP